MEKHKLGIFIILILLVIFWDENDNQSISTITAQLRILVRKYWAKVFGLAGKK